MSIGKLILYPGSTASPAAKTVLQSLHTLELIGEPLDSDRNSFLTGKNFLQLISFMGCSTNICLTPQANTESSFSSVTIRGPFQQPQLVWGRGCRPPRCPGCSKPIHDWEESFNGTTLNCKQCGTASGAGDINWGKYAGYGHMFIEINNVFPGEATPVDLLFDRLKRDTEAEWQYFFIGHG